MLRKQYSNENKPKLLKQIAKSKNLKEKQTFLLRSLL
jgi:hypothetical protein